MRKLYLLGAILLIAIISGCQSGAETPARNTAPFVGGTQGLLITFLENAPPAEIADSGQFPFNIVVGIENVGEHSIPASVADPANPGSMIRQPLTIRLRGLFPGDFALPINVKDGVASSRLSTIESVFEDHLGTQNLQGVRKSSDGDVLPGDKLFFSFPDLHAGQPDESDSQMLYMPTLQGNIELPVRADVCYTYQTKVSTNYCLREDATSAEQGVCIVNEAKTVHNSGAPVHVSSVKQSAAGRERVLFTITVKEVGNGRVFERDTTCDAAYETNFIDENRVHVTVNPNINDLPAGAFNCNGLQNSFLRLNSGTGVFTCSLDTSGIDGIVDAVKDMSVTLEYDYLETKSTEILVKHILTE